MHLIVHLAAHPACSLALTIAAYAVGIKLHYRWTWVPPIVVACVPIILVLLLAHQPYAVYSRGGNLLAWWLGPATVALATPMYRNGRALRGSLPRLALIVIIGSIVGMVTAGVTAWLFGAPLPVVMSAVPKSVTTPIAIEVCRELKGIPQITIAMVLLTGVLGASFATPLLRLARVRNHHAIGVAMGTAAHGIGTASLVRRSQVQATASSWAMAAAGVFTSLLAMLLRLFLH